MTQDIRRMERAAGDAEPALMERAGAAAAGIAATLAGDTAKDVLVLAGPGNNGGDAHVVARLLKEMFFRVEVVSQVDQIPQKPWGLVIDGLFGIGLARDIAGEHAALVDYANRQPCPVLALDIPSGLHSDTGRVLGRAVRATHTVTFIALKPGLLTLDGPDHSGEIIVSDLNLPVTELLAPTAWVAEPKLFRHLLKPRPRNFHKGMAGSLAILGGAAGMTGA
ncbi:MAG TPA: NAD(P)H-hydrate epimerase, partial [Burkholderiales bacterium]|nr:NAD(P)H-hydrate epimerase [Burkholderiales bacterium]